MKILRTIVSSRRTADSADGQETYITNVNQEFTSENTSINSTKLPAIFKMVSFEPGTINLDMGGGKFDNVAEYLSEYDVINLVYDPYNRSRAHNSEVIKTLRSAGGADTATCSNVLNVIKEPEARINVLENMSKLVKPGGDIYITVYEGRGDSKEGPTKSGYQLNRKTQDYLEEIREVFPDAVRRGKLIIATNSRSVTSSMKENLDTNKDSIEIYDIIKRAILGHQASIKYLKEQGYKVHKLVNPLQIAEVDTYEITDASGYRFNYDNTIRSANSSVNCSYDGGSTSWMAKYRDLNGAMHKVWTILPTSDFDYANELLEEVLPPYTEYRLLGTAPHSKALESDEFEYLASGYDETINSSKNISAIEAGRDDSVYYDMSAILHELKSDIADIVDEVVRNYLGYDGADANTSDYYAVEVTKEDHTYVRIEVRAEVDYEGLEDLDEALNEYVTKFDSDAYFEPVDPGITECYINYRKVAAALGQ